ncbi:hypothetical protein ACHAWO_005927 [Cyclotella atomus]|uniref:Uncharacterized protein n=1 Tax=Cyclotella atomus TaxID=382360 RepID=A0ABD3NUT8_9STRA
MQTIHAGCLESKKEQLRQANELVAGMQEMFEEMTKEVMDATTESEDAMKRMDRLKSKAVSAHAKYIEHKLLANELNDEVRDNCLDEQQRDFDSIVKYIDKYYAKEAASPKPIAKHYVPNKSSGGKHAEWLPHVDKLIMEMLANRTPPTCIQANIYAMAQAIFPDYDIVKEIPSLKHIKNLRTAMYTVAKTLAAYQLDILVCGGRISLQSAGAIGQMRYNNDMGRDISALITGRKRKSNDSDNKKLGLFHRIPPECATSLVALAKQRLRKSSGSQTTKA